jgi:hypothetical protein
VLELLGAVKKLATQVKTVVVTSSSAAVINYERAATSSTVRAKEFGGEDWNPVK